MNRYTTFDSPLGQILLVSDGSSRTGAYFSGQKYEPVPAQGHGWQPEPDVEIFRDASFQLHEYFAGKRSQFDIPLHLQGTSFQIKVWNALLEIPHGDTVSYGELAERIKRKDAARAVGAAVGRNPVSVIVPCHRVIGSGGSLTGYAGGLERKRSLLDLEAGARGHL
jgi:methylated-DNA-[protein]-cysteine S-methyltransferase